MRLRFLRSIASFDFGYHAGDVADIDEAVAQAWIASGVAVADPATPAAASVPETAMAGGARERAAKKRGGAR